MGKRLALVGLAVLLAHCADPYAAAPNGGGPGGPGAATDGGVDGATSARLALGTVPDIIVVPGTSATVPVTITRSGIEGPVVVAVTGAPPGVDAPPVTIAATDTTAAISISVAAGTTFPTAKITFVATSGEERAAQTTSLLLRGKAGAVDESFGSGGVAPGLLRPPGEATDLAIRADGSYVILANTADRAVLAPVTRDGEVTSPASALAFASAGALVVEPRGGLVVGGLDLAPTGNTLSLRHYVSPSFDADMTFGKNGRVGLGEAGMTGGVRDIVVRDRGFLVLHDAARPRVTAVTVAGQLDATWGSVGAAELAPGSALSLVPFGKSWVAFSFDSVRTAYAATTLGPMGTAGNAVRVATSPAAVSGVRPRAASDGSAAYLPVVDTGAASYGLTRYDDAVSTFPVDVTSPGVGTVVQADGKVVVVFVSLQRIVLGRFDPRTGTRDLAFGATGVVGVPIEGVSSARIYLQPDGRLVGFANVETNKTTQVSMFRVWL